MLFASSKDALRRALVGIAAEIQGTDFSEVAHESGMSPHSQRLCSTALNYLRLSSSITVLDKVSRGA